MNASALVLNRSFVAVQVASWERAIILLFQGHAEVCDRDLQTFDFKDWCELSKMMKTHPLGFVHSTNLRIAIPECIRLTRYDRIPRNEVVFTRRNILEHYGYHCAYCNNKFDSKDLTFDHFIPKSKGGKTNWENILPACYICNGKKDDLTPREAGLKVYFHPSKPKYQLVFKRLMLSLPIQTRLSWQKMIDKMYWNAELDED